MNYIKEINSFYDWCALNRPSTGQVVLWQGLMQINNKTGWKEWFTVANITLQLYTGLSKTGIESSREYLIDCGRIQCKKGGPNKAASYKMVPFCMNSTSQNSGVQIGVEEVVPIVVENSTSQNSGVHLSEFGRSSGPLININKTNNIYTIFSHWNNSNIKKHNKISPQAETQLKWKLDNYEPEELLHSITTYSTILNDDNYLLDTRWSLEDFLSKNHYTKFLQDADPYSYYRRHQKNVVHLHANKAEIEDQRKRDYVQMMMEAQTKTYDTNL